MRVGGQESPCAWRAHRACHPVVKGRSDYAMPVSASKRHSKRSSRRRWSFHAASMIPKKRTKQLERALTALSCHFARHLVEMWEARFTSLWLALHQKRTARSTVRTCQHRATLVRSRASVGFRGRTDRATVPATAAPPAHVPEEPS